MNSESQARCIICKQAHLHQTVEHIIPQSLGNLHYLLHKGLICQTCNQRFSRYENRVVSSLEFMNERQQRGFNGLQEVSLKKLNDQDALFVLLKIAYESLYKSRRAVFDNLDHKRILNTLHRGEKYPLQLIKNKALKDAKSIPRIIDRWRLRGLEISLRYKLQTHLNRCTIEWRYGDLSFITYLSIKYLDGRV